jgi:hypothetical protein
MGDGQTLAVWLGCCRGYILTPLREGAVDNNAPSQERVLNEAEEIALAAWRTTRRFVKDYREILSRSIDHEVVALRARRIADRLYRLNGRTGFFAWIDYLPFGTAFLKWSLPNDIEMTPGGVGYQVPAASPVGTGILIPDEAARLARKALATPDVSEVAIFTETSDPVLAARMSDGSWFEIMRWD